MIPLPDDGSVPDPADAFALPLTGDLAYIDGFNANGIVASDGWLILVQSNTGLLFRVDPTTGATETIDLGGASVSFGDGLELVGSTLYVVRNQLGEILEIRLADDLLSGTVVDTLEPEGVDVPTTAAFIAGRLWLVNARFNTAPAARHRVLADRHPALTRRAPQGAGRTGTTGGSRDAALPVSSRP